MYENVYNFCKLRNRILVNYHLQAENQYFTNKTAVGIRIAIYINDQCVTYVGPENLG